MIMDYYTDGLTAFGWSVRPTEEQREKLAEAVKACRAAKERYEIATYEDGEGPAVDDDYAAYETARKALAHCRAGVVLELAQRLAEEIQHA